MAAANCIDTAEKRKGSQKWWNETGISSGKTRHHHAHSWMTFFATFCGGFAANPVFFDASALNRLEFRRMPIAVGLRVYVS
jgi:hypothetical protein